VGPEKVRKKRGPGLPQGVLIILVVSGFRPNYKTEKDGYANFRPYFSQA
jgi:hypothetical protein